eukprot:3972186-Alexandrium_andersonii.AAC.1
MCIRDRRHDFVICQCPARGLGPLVFVAQGLVVRSANVEADARGVWSPLLEVACLLYTSDAADDM